MKFLKMIFFSLSLSLFLSACASENEETVTKDQSEEENKTENKTEEKKQTEEKNEENTKSVKLVIPNQESYNKLTVNLNNQDDPDSKASFKILTEQDDISTFIEKMDKIEVKAKNEAEELVDYLTAMVEEPSYFFELSSEENREDQRFSVFFFLDGQAVLVEQDSSKKDQEKIYISKAKHPELLQELKDSLSLPF